MTLQEGGNAAVAMIAPLAMLSAASAPGTVIKIKGLMRQQITLLGSSPPTLLRRELRAALSPLGVLSGVCFGETESVDVYLKKKPFGYRHI